MVVRNVLKVDGFKIFKKYARLSSNFELLRNFFLPLCELRFDIQQLIHFFKLQWDVLLPFLNDIIESLERDSLLLVEILKEKVLDF